MSHVVPYLGGTLRPRLIWGWAAPPPWWTWRWQWQNGRWEVVWFRINPRLRPRYAYTDVWALTNMDPAGQPNVVSAA